MEEAGMSVCAIITPKTRMLNFRLESFLGLLIGGLGGWVSAFLYDGVKGLITSAKDGELWATETL